MTDLDIAATGDAPARPTIRKINVSDLKAALTAGINDFKVMPSHAVFLSLIYPVVALFAARMASNSAAMPLFLPLTTGFALVGPFAAIGLYEISRRRELGLQATWIDAFKVLRSKSIGAIAALALVLTVIFLCWLAVAQKLFQLFYPQPAATLTHLARDILTTSAGHTLIFVGSGIGLLFAIVVLTIAAVSFPMLLDRNVGVATAMETSIRTVFVNPVTMALWGLIIVIGLIIGSLPFFMGLAVVMPVLGHSTWHLYRRVVSFK
jgi:uncharacterized membrane protein